MLNAERHFIILQVLKEKETATVHELSEATGASVSTIRRDLVQLEEENQLKRIHGGASLFRSKGTEPSLGEKSTQNMAEKEKIASYAAELVKDGDCIFLDAGTTTQKMAPFLQHKQVIVVTNGYQVIESLLAEGITTYVIGGKFKSRTGAMTGVKALESIETYRFDKCFIGINGIHESLGYTTADPDEAIIKQAAIRLSRDAYILADYSKIGEAAFSKVADIEACTIITNEHPETNYDQVSKHTTVEVVKI
ncbi:DeoR/GlpR family DNA-binding transcription regulator [Pseudalkalibacillus hwajinpoensis]|uniref:DeoR/GlpR family DNA-binding transcription regulator n=1 Tax=Guptibacillus hwajinpoensis TaxID=208199 RepID=UPI001CD71BB8|nr:DeoR/GlpR family DNA-binding transcription regulator [Pseudalkalibacillus hwajinpoensis]MCA0992368.1 DeoR/GlpR family DNA-binding transcription regulator [Pseudalkalibacillus hwajinpoensis]